MMIANRFTVLIDTCVLFSAFERNFCLSLAEGGLFRPRWSERTLEELEVVLVRQKVLPKDAANVQVDRIRRAFPEGVVENYENIEGAFSLPDKNDHHVLAAAIKSRAALLVTHDLKDFPKETLELFEIEPIKPDNFFADVITLSIPESLTAIRAMRTRLKRPDMSTEAFVINCEKRGLNQTANILEEHLQFI